MITHHMQCLLLIPMVFLSYNITGFKISYRNNNIERESHRMKESRYTKYIKNIYCKHLKYKYKIEIRRYGFNHFSVGLFLPLTGEISDVFLIGPND